MSSSARLYFTFPVHGLRFCPFSSPHVPLVYEAVHVTDERKSLVHYLKPTNLPTKSIVNSVPPFIYNTTALHLLTYQHPQQLQSKAPQQTVNIVAKLHPRRRLAAAVLGSPPLMLVSVFVHSGGALQLIAALDRWIPYSKETV